MNTDKHIKPFVYIAIMLAILFCRTFWGIDIPVVSMLLLTIVFGALGDTTDITSMAVCMIPFTKGFQYKYALLILVLFLIIKSNFKLNYKKNVPILIAMMLWEWMHGFGFNFSIVEFFRSFAELIFLMIFICVDDDVDYKVILRSFSVAVVGICLILFSINLKRFNNSIVDYLAAGALSLRFGQKTTEFEYGLIFNPNALGFICCLSMLGELFLINKSKEKKFSVIMIIFSIFFGLLTQSKTYLVCLIFIVFYYIYATGSEIKQKIKNSVMVVLLLLTVWIITVNVFPQIILNIIRRFNVADISNGRTDLLGFYMRHIVSSWKYFFFGIGLQEFQTKITSIYGYEVEVCHNGIQEVWVVWGIIGVGLFAALIWSILKDSEIMWNKDTKILYLPLFLMILYTMAGQLIRSGSVLLSLLIIYISLNSGNKATIQNKLLNV